MHAQSRSATPQTVAHQAPLFMRFSRQEYRSRLAFLPPGMQNELLLKNWVGIHLPASAVTLYCLTCSLTKYSREVSLFSLGGV